MRNSSLFITPFWGTLLFLMNVVFSSGCASVTGRSLDMALPPNLLVQVVDCDTKEPIPNVPLVYNGMTRSILSLGIDYLRESREYVANEKGEVLIPASEFKTMYPAGSFEHLYRRCDPPKGRREPSEVQANDVIFLQRRPQRQTER